MFYNNNCDVSAHREMIKQMLRVCSCDFYIIQGLNDVHARMDEKNKMELSRLTGVSWNGCTEMPLSTRSRVGGRGGNHVRFMRRDDLPSSNSYKEVKRCLEFIFERLWFRYIPRRVSISFPIK